MSIEVNGQNIDFVKNETVENLLKRMKYTFPLIIVKINDKLIEKKEYTNFVVPDKAKISVIHMISGG